MSIERWVMRIAGVFILVSLALGVWVSPYWLLFTAFVGLNLFQTSLLAAAGSTWCRRCLRRSSLRAA